MSVSVEQYEATPALTIDWDLELADTEARARKAVEERAR